jgi:hypothetical protein
MADNWNIKWREIINTHINSNGVDIYCRNIKEKITFTLAAEYLKDCSNIEDWGCGPICYFKNFVNDNIVYVGIDGSMSLTNNKHDLSTYVSKTEGLVMRHVLEHNELSVWEKILANALQSFTKKMCLILFTPFSNETTILNRNEGSYNYVPTISFSKQDIIDIIEKNNCTFTLNENIETDTQFGLEHIFYINK